MAKKIEDISKVLKEIKFKKKFFGGVDELDVWNKIESINLEYKENVIVTLESNKSKKEKLENAQIEIITQEITDDKVIINV